jgi:hypothetical protein
VFERFALCALLRPLFTRADEVEVQGRGLRIHGLTGRPGFRLGNIVAEQQSVRRSTALVPLRCTLKVTCVIANPINVSVESGYQFHHATAENLTAAPIQGL